MRWTEGNCYKSQLLWLSVCEFICVVWFYWRAVRSVHSSMCTYFIKLLFYSLSLSEYKFQVYITFVVKVRGVKKQKIVFCFFFILSQFQISKYHEYVLIKSTISVFPRAHWHVSFFTKNNKGPLSFFSHIYLAVLSLSSPRIPESLCIMNWDQLLCCLPPQKTCFFSSRFILYSFMNY